MLGANLSLLGRRRCNGVLSQWRKSACTPGDIAFARAFPLAAVNTTNQKLHLSARFSSEARSAIVEDASSAAATPSAESIAFAASASATTTAAPNSAASNSLAATAVGSTATAPAAEAGATPPGKKGKKSKQKANAQPGGQAESPGGPVTSPSSSSADDGVGTGAASGAASGAADKSATAIAAGGEAKKVDDKQQQQPKKKKQAAQQAGTAASTTSDSAAAVSDSAATATATSPTASAAGTAAKQSQPKQQQQQQQKQQPQKQTKQPQRHEIANRHGGRNHSVDGARVSVNDADALPSYIYLDQRTARLASRFKEFPGVKRYLKYSTDGIRPPVTPAASAPSPDSSSATSASSSGKDSGGSGMSAAAKAVLRLSPPPSVLARRGAIEARAMLCLDGWITPKEALDTIIPDTHVADVIGGRLHGVDAGSSNVTEGRHLYPDPRSSRPNAGSSGLDDGAAPTSSGNSGVIVNSNPCPEADAALTLLEYAVFSLRQHGMTSSGGGGGGGADIDSTFLNIILRRCSRLPHVQYMRRAVNIAAALGKGPSLEPRTLLFALTGFTTHRDAAAVADLQRSMHTLPSMLTLATHVRLVTGFFVTNQHDKALKLLDRCRSAGLPMGPLLISVMDDVVRSYPSEPSRRSLKRKKDLLQRYYQRAASSAWDRHRHGRVSGSTAAAPSSSSSGGSSGSNSIGVYSAPELRDPDLVSTATRYIQAADDLQQRDAAMQRAAQDAMAVLRSLIAHYSTAAPATAVTSDEIDVLLGLLSCQPLSKLWMDAKFRTAIDLEIAAVASGALDPRKVDPAIIEIMTQQSVAAMGGAGAAEPLFPGSGLTFGSGSTAAGGAVEAAVGVQRPANRLPNVSQIQSSTILADGRLDFEYTDLLTGATKHIVVSDRTGRALSRTQFDYCFAEGGSETYLNIMDADRDGFALEWAEAEMAARNVLPPPSSSSSSSSSSATKSARNEAEYEAELHRLAGQAPLLDNEAPWWHLNTFAPRRGQLLNLLSAALHSDRIAAVASPITLRQSLVALLRSLDDAGHPTGALAGESGPSETLRHLLSSVSHPLDPVLSSVTAASHTMHTLMPLRDLAMGLAQTNSVGNGVDVGTGGSSIGGEDGAASATSDATDAGAAAVSVQWLVAAIQSLDATTLPTAATQHRGDGGSSGSSSDGTGSDGSDSDSRSIYPIDHLRGKQRRETSARVANASGAGNGGGGSSSSSVVDAFVVEGADRHSSTRIIPGVGFATGDASSPQFHPALIGSAIGSSATSVAPGTAAASTNALSLAQVAARLVTTGIASGSSGSGINAPSLLSNPAASAAANFGSTLTPYQVNQRIAVVSGLYLRLLDLQKQETAAAMAAAAAAAAASGDALTAQQQQQPPSSSSPRSRKQKQQQLAPSSAAPAAASAVHPMMESALNKPAARQSTNTGGPGAAGGSSASAGRPQPAALSPLLPPQLHSAVATRLLSHNRVLAAAQVVHAMDSMLPPSPSASSSSSAAAASVAASAAASALCDRVVAALCRAADAAEAAAPPTPAAAAPLPPSSSSSSSATSVNLPQLLSAALRPDIAPGSAQQQLESHNSLRTAATAWAHAVLAASAAKQSISAAEVVALSTRASTAPGTSAAACVGGGAATGSDSLPSGAAPAPVAVDAEASAGVTADSQTHEEAGKREQAITGELQSAAEAAAAGSADRLASTAVTAASTAPPSAAASPRLSTPAPLAAPPSLPVGFESILYHRLMDSDDRAVEAVANKLVSLLLRHTQLHGLDQPSLRRALQSGSVVSVSPAAPSTSSSVPPPSAATVRLVTALLTGDSNDDSSSGTGYHYSNHGGPANPSSAMEQAVGVAAGGAGDHLQALYWSEDQRLMLNAGTGGSGVRDGTGNLNGDGSSMNHRQHTRVLNVVLLLRALTFNAHHHHHGRRGADA